MTVTFNQQKWKVNPIYVGRLVEKVVDGKKKYKIDKKRPKMIDKSNKI